MLFYLLIKLVVKLQLFRAVERRKLYLHTNFDDRDEYAVYERKILQAYKEGKDSFVIEISFSEFERYKKWLENSWFKPLWSGAYFLDKDNYHSIKLIFKHPDKVEV